ncbi:1-deoxy-D-xylulose-5-phosphate reductoisomerase [Candidatus Pelagibacter sp.]|nr:1-deoxy-D-xylulose-5-phosphate reductoisomerase [Candidatus Pelagibacter sp.]
MKKKIAIIGSTGSIGKSLIDILKKNKKEIEIILLTADKNYQEILLQAKFFNVKNLIITNRDIYLKLKKNKVSKKVNIYNDYDAFKTIFKKKIDYTMSSISGLNGLLPTIKIIKHTKKIAIANKEGIICAWNLISKELNKYKTKFIPVDSEHFSLWYGLQGSSVKSVEEIYLTASGGPLYKTSLKKFKNIKKSQALNHPNWSMGKKISIDSATMINKIFEVIEAKKIFDISYDKIKIIIHPKSYIHAILKFDNGLTKIIVHDTTMKVPIFNTLFFDDMRNLKSKKLDIKVLNQLELDSVNLKRYPMIKLLDLIPKHHSLFETLIVSANDILVEKFLNNEIKFVDIQKNLFKILKYKEFLKFKKIKPHNINEIIKLNDYVRLKINRMSI